MATADSTKARGVRVVLYLRASSDDQTESIPAQRMMLERYASDHGLEIVGEYSDFAISGDSCRSRPDLQRLLADAKRGMFEGILVRQLSRLSRRNSIKSARQIIDPLLDAGITIYTASHGDLKLDSATGRIMLAILCEFDHSENVSRSLNVVNGQLRAATNGSWIGGVPYGYRIEGTKGKKRLVLGDELAVQTVRRIFHLYAAGESCEAIARLLNAEGIPSPKGGIWIRDVVRDMFDRPAYVGDHRYNYKSEGKYHAVRDGKIIERKGHWADDEQEHAKAIRNKPEDWVYIRDHWPAIVDRETWDRVQRRLQHNADSKPGPTDKTFVLTGVLRCNCGCARDMYGKFRAGKKRYQCDGCGGWVVESEVLNAMVRGIKSSLNPAVLTQLRAEVERQTAEPKATAPDIKALEKELAKQERKLVVLDADMVVPVQAEIRRLRRQIEQARRASLNGSKASPDAIVDRALSGLFKLPDVLRQSDEKRLKADLAELLGAVNVTSEAKGRGKGMRWSLVDGDVLLTCHDAVGVEPRISWVSSRRLCRWTTGSKERMRDKG